MTKFEEEQSDPSPFSYTDEMPYSQQNAPSTLGWGPHACEMPRVVLEALYGNRGKDQQDIAAAGLQLIEKVLEKNTDYGSSVFHPPVLAPHVSARDALRARQSDKVKRIIQLAEQPPEVSGESLNDSLDDFAGYNILDLVLRKRNNDK